MAAQLRYERVRNAFETAGGRLRADFKERHLAFPPKNIFFRVFKKERVFQVWIGSGRAFHLFRDYEIAASSGTLGPKRESGDNQVPEGCYFIDRFNPLSKFHLSLGLDYPNASDKVWGRPGRLGGDIFVHGGSATIGCIPLTNDKIEEVYVLAVEARTQGQKIPIHIFPTRMSGRDLEDAIASFPHFETFWRTLVPIYLSFENTHRLAPITTDAKGNYVIKVGSARRP